MLSLYNFDIHHIMGKYGFTHTTPQSVTIEDNKPRILSSSILPTNSSHFINTSINKYNIRYSICMIDDLNNLMPQTTDLCCWYDTEPFKSIPIAIPIKCIRDKQFIHHLSKSMNIKFGDVIFEGEGVFCSLECCKTYVMKNPSNLYKDVSANLLIYKGLLEYKEDIKCRGSVKSLKKFGGTQTIEEFRNNNVKYIDTINLIKPYMFPIGNLLREIK